MIGTVELLKLVKEEGLVEGLSERELTNPEGAGFDLRVGEVYELEGGGTFLGVDDRKLPKTNLIGKYGDDKDIILYPRRYVLVKTIEKVKLPNDVSAIIRPRSTLQRCGVQLVTAAVGPGYEGELTFGMYNLRDVDSFKLELGARIAHILFDRTGENVRSYEGQHQYGRVSSEGKTETQV